MTLTRTGHQSTKSPQDSVGRRHRLRGPVIMVATMAALIIGTAACSSSSTTATTVTSTTGTTSTTSAAPQQGVTSSSIKVGAPYVDLASLASLGITINQGSYPDAYNALIGNINDTGGINGRTLNVVLTAVNPTGPAGAATACT